MFRAGFRAANLSHAEQLTKGSSTNTHKPRFEYNVGYRAFILNQMILFGYECTLHAIKHEGTIKAENILRATEDLRRKYDKVEQLFIIKKL